MTKRFLISVIVIFILWMGLDFLIHGQLLHSDYSQLPNLFRSEQDSQQYFVYMLFAHVLMSVGFVWIYLKGKEDKPFVGQGLRFGLAVALLMEIPGYMIYYVVQPLPTEMVCKQMVFSTIEVLVLGVAVAWLNK
jgi:hypothetical protein